MKLSLPPPVTSSATTKIRLGICCQEVPSVVHLLLLESSRSGRTSCILAMLALYRTIRSGCSWVSQAIRFALLQKTIVCESVALSRILLLSVARIARLPLTFIEPHSSPNKMSAGHATKQEIDEFFKHTKSHAANKVGLPGSREKGRDG